MSSASTVEGAPTLKTEVPAAATQGLLKTLKLTDLLFFGLANVLGTGAANLAGHAMFASGSTWPYQIVGVTGLLLGSSKTYTVAHEKYHSNNADVSLIGEEIGAVGKGLASLMTVFLNIITVAVGLVFITRVINPTASYAFSTMLAIQLAILLTAISIYGIELNKSLINIVMSLSIGVIAVFSLFAINKWISAGTYIQNIDVATNNTFDPIRGFLYIFFILAGYEVLIKFTEETTEQSNIPKAFYGANILSALLLIGLCFAYIIFVPMRGLKHADNSFADIAKGIFGDGEASIMKWIVIGFVFIGALVNYVGVSRFVYSDIKDTIFEGWRELNTHQAPWKIILGLGATLIGFIVVNNIDKLVSLADICLVIVLSMVSWSAARTQLKAGKKPWVESLTTLGLFGVGGLSIRQLFQTNKKHNNAVAI